MRPVAPPLCLTSYRVFLALSVVLGSGLSATRLLGVHGVESALALGIVLPPACGWVAARMLVHARTHQNLGAADIGRLLRNTCATAATLWAVPTALLGFNAYRIKQCAPWTGLLFMLLGPLCGCLLSAMLGTALAACSRRAWLSTTLAVTPPLLGLGQWAFEFYTSPAVFAYGHFFGYFPGSIYDEQIHIPWALVSLRAGSLSYFLFAVWLLLACLHPGTLRLKVIPRVPWLAFAAFGSLGAGALITGYGEALGIRTSDAHIQQTLGGHLTSERCELFVPREMEHKARFGDDCDFRVSQMERFFDLPGQRPVRVYVFRNAKEKRRLMGAAQTNIAKPWRREIYLQQSRFPHPVMAHELAHVVAGQAGVGPFRVAAALGGMWPNPGIIEGMAVAADFHPSQGLTPHQWARAMIELDMVPPLREIFGPGFLGQSSRLAYTLAGSILRYVHETRGSKALQAIYRTGDLERALGEPLGQLQGAWREWLSNVELTNEAVELARLRFSGGSVFSNVCPHRVAELKANLSADLAARDDAAAEHTCRAILEADPAQVATRVDLMGILFRQGDVEGAKREYKTLEGPPRAAAALLARAKHQLADEAFRAGRREEALEHYRALLRSPLSQDTRRLVEVKAIALDASRTQADLIFAFLIGEDRTATDGATAVHLLRELKALRRDGLASYLEGRQLLHRQRFARAERLFGEALDRKLPSETLSLEALRVRAISAYGAEHFSQAESLFRLLEEEGSPAHRWEARDWLARLTHQRLDLAP